MVATSSYALLGQTYFVSLLGSCRVKSCHCPGHGRCGMVLRRIYVNSKYWSSQNRIRLQQFVDTKAQVREGGHAVKTFRATLILPSEQVAGKNGNVARSTSTETLISSGYSTCDLHRLRPIWQLASKRAFMKVVTKWVRVRNVAVMFASQKN